jgi:hypothetical protein
MPSTLQIALAACVIAVGLLIRRSRVLTGVFAAVGAVLALVLLLIELTAGNRSWVYAYLVVFVPLALLALVMLVRRHRVRRDPKEKIQKRLTPRDVLMPATDPSWAQTCWRTGAREVRMARVKVPRPVVAGLLEYTESERLQVPLCEQPLSTQLGMMAVRWINRPFVLIAILALTVFYGLVHGWAWAAALGGALLVLFLLAVRWLRKQEGFRLRWIAADRSWMVIRFASPERADQVRKELAGFFGASQPGE